MSTDWMTDIQALPTAQRWCDGNPGIAPKVWDGGDWPNSKECEGNGTHILEDLVLCDEDAEWFKKAGFHPRPVS